MVLVGAAIATVLCAATAGAVARGEHAAPRNFTNTTSSTIHEPGAVKEQLNAVSCTNAFDCKAVGWYIKSGQWTPEIGSLNNAGWSVDMTPAITNVAGAQLNGVSCVGARFCLAVGGTTVGSSSSPQDRILAERWSGGSWSVVSTGTIGGALYGVSCISSSFCMAVGEWQASSGQQRSRVLVFNGSTWTIIPSASPAGTNNLLYGVSCFSHSSCTAVGTSDQVIGGFATGTPSASTRTMIEQWNGNVLAFRSINPGESDSLSSVSCPAANDCELVGYNGQANTLGEKPLIIKLTGSTWTNQVPPANSPSWEFSQLLGVACTSTTLCYGVGDLVTLANAGNTKFSVMTYSYTGTSWALYPSANVSSSTSNGLYGVSCVAGSCEGVGARSTLSTSKNLIEHQP